MQKYACKEKSVWNFLKSHRKEKMRIGMEKTGLTMNSNCWYSFLGLITWGFIVLFYLFLYTLENFRKKMSISNKSKQAIRLRKTPYLLRDSFYIKFKKRQNKSQVEVVIFGGRNTADAWRGFLDLSDGLFLYPDGPATWWKFTALSI